MNTTRRKRPATVTLVVVLMYIAGITDIVFGIITIFARYGVDENSDETLRVTIAVIGAVLVLFGLFVIALASGISRGSRFSRIATTVILGLGLVIDAVNFAADPSSGLTALIVQTVAYGAIAALLWLPPGARYFAKA